MIPHPTDELDEEATASTGPVQPAAPPLLAGRYRVIRSIAKGGMGEVLLAEHVDLQRRVALKVMRPPRHGADGVDFEARFRTEARTLAQLHHPHVVTVHDFGVLPTGRFYLAMEYVEGARLADVLAEGRVPVDRALRLAMQTAQALGYAHKHGVVHRDLTPSNLLVATDVDGHDHIKLVDFGIVKVDRSDAEETQEGVVLGSPHCMAPEQIDGVGVDARTDIYAFGVLLYRLLTGVYPFRGTQTMAILMAHLDAPVPPFAEAAPDRMISEGLERITRRCLAKRQDDRYPDVDSLLADLTAEAGVDALGTTLAVTLPQDLRAAAQAARVEVDRRIARPLVLTAVLALLGAAVLGLVGVLLLARAPAPAEVPEGSLPAPPPPVAAGTVSEEGAPTAEVAPPDQARPDQAGRDQAGRDQASRDQPRPQPQRPAQAAPAPKPRKAEPAPAPAAEPAPSRPSRAPSGYKGLPSDF